MDNILTGKIKPLYFKYLISASGSSLMASIFGMIDAMMVGKYPSCVLNISVPFDLVDVNVHPTKMEVRFSDGPSVYN